MGCQMCPHLGQEGDPMDSSSGHCGVSSGKKAPFGTFQNSGYEIRDFAAREDEDGFELEALRTRKTGRGH